MSSTICIYIHRGVYQYSFLRARVRVRIRVRIRVRVNIKARVRFYMIACIALVSKTNEPVILRTYVDTEDEIPTTWREVGDSDGHPARPQLTVTNIELRLHHVIYCSLDVEARAAERGKGNDMFLGHLSAMDNFRWVVCGIG